MAYAVKAAKLLSERSGGASAVCVCETTMIEARRLIDGGCPDAHIVLADRQTAGRGRLGRSFISPEGKGVYLSYIKYLPRETENLPLLTSFVGVAVCRAVDGFLPIDAPRCRLKWPNDVMLDGKKICGILVNLITDTAQNVITHAIIGVGINVSESEEDFPPELREKAGSVHSIAGVSVPLEKLCAALADEFDSMFFKEKILSCDAAPLREVLRRRSYTLGREVEFELGGRRMRGRAADLNADGSLLVRGEFGEMSLSTGEAVVIV